MILQNQIKESIDLVVCIFQHSHSVLHSLQTLAHSILFIYTSSFWFICKLLPLDECLHVSTWMAGGCLRVSFQYQTRSADKEQKIFDIFGNFIHAILSGIHVECVSTHKHSLCDAKKSRGFILYTNCASKSTLAADTQTLQIFILHSILFSVHHTMMLFLLFTRMDYIHSPLSFGTFVFITYISHTWAFY